MDNVVTDSYQPQEDSQRHKTDSQRHHSAYHTDSHFFHHADSNQNQSSICFLFAFTSLLNAHNIPITVQRGLIEQACEYEIGTNDSDELIKKIGFKIMYRIDFEQLTASAMYKKLLTLNINVSNVAQATIITHNKDRLHDIIIKRINSDKVEYEDYEGTNVMSMRRFTRKFISLYYTDTDLSNNNNIETNSKLLNNFLK